MGSTHKWEVNSEANIPLYTETQTDVIGKFGYLKLKVKIAVGKRCAYVVVHHKH